jgi:hypothetical protein
LPERLRALSVGHVAVTEHRRPFALIARLVPDS